MKIVLKDGGRFVFRFARGDEVLGELKDFCIKNQIEAAWFSGVGLCDTLTIAFYDLETKKYIEKHSIEPLEIASLTGNVGTMNGATTVHAHGVFSNKSHHTIGGHVKKLVVSANAEVLMTRLAGTLKRVPDLDTRLNLFR